MEADTAQSTAPLAVACSALVHSAGCTLWGLPLLPWLYKLCAIMMVLAQSHLRFSYLQHFVVVRDNAVLIEVFWPLGGRNAPQ